MIRRMFKENEASSTLEDKMKAIESKDGWSDALKSLFSHPPISEDTAIGDLKFLAIDFETTGLNVENDKILSIGMVEFTLDEIDITSSEELLIDNGEFIKAETATINGLTPKALSDGIPLQQGVERLLEKAQGKVILAHSCRIEKCFIEAFFKQQYQLDFFPVYFVDTIFVEKRFSYAGKTGAHKSYQLIDMRRHYKLPEYMEHSAASDALACAELFIVQTKKLKLQDIKGMCLKKIHS